MPDRRLDEVRSKLVRLLRSDPPPADAPLALDRYVVARCSREEIEVMLRAEREYGETAMAEWLAEVLVEAGLVRPARCSAGTTSSARRARSAPAPRTRPEAAHRSAGRARPGNDLEPGARDRRLGLAVRPAPAGDRRSTPAGRGPAARRRAGRARTCSRRRSAPPGRRTRRISRERRAEVVDAAEDEAGDHGVEGAVAERQRLGAREDEGDPGRARARAGEVLARCGSMATTRRPGGKSGRFRPVPAPSSSVRPRAPPASHRASGRGRPARGARGERSYSQGICSRPRMIV